MLVGMLHALGEDLDSDRETLDDLVRRYRIATFGKHMLIILDNAVGDLQLEPLLPNSSAPTVLITGRTRMASVSEANTLQVGPMSRADAFLLLTAVVGAYRMAESSGEARDIIAHCAGLPLALRIVGTRLAGRTHWTAAVRLAARLGNPRARLDELRLGGPRCPPQPVRVRDPTAAGMPGVPEPPRQNGPKSRLRGGRRGRAGDAGGARRADAGNPGGRGAHERRGGSTARSG
ncbi:hypothetical protein GCM10020000_12940 [Streptomyces olivoverticillatus]